MINRLRAWASCSLLVLCALHAGCASAPPKPDPVKISIVARGDINPDASGRPSPVVLRIYQLKDDAAFKDADFFALFDKEQQTLGSALLERHEFVMSPADEKAKEYEVAAGAKFIGAVAAFRNLADADWRSLAVAPNKGIKNMVKKDKMAIVVERLKVSVSVSE